MVCSSFSDGLYVAGKNLEKRNNINLQWINVKDRLPEYKETHKDSIKEYQKEYYKNHKK